MSSGRSLRRIAGTAVLAALAAACGSRSSPIGPSGTPAAPGVVPVMGLSRIGPEQLVSWFRSRQPQPTGTYRASEPVENLVRYYLEEGAAEGVAGDVAFTQSILETGWFRFGGVVQPSANNFAGIGATDVNPRPATFPDARTGIRAQIQHLRAYADATALTCTVPPLHNLCVDPRFDLVVPKGKAPTWNVMGNGNWATSTTYAANILRLYEEARMFAGVR